MVMEKPYSNHPVFKKLSKYAKFYDHLSFSTHSFITMGANSVINMDTYVYTSMQGTLESIGSILRKGRINDAYALLRKYYDAAVINIFTALYLDEHFNLENFVVEKIDNWLQGKEQLPSIRIMNNYIQKSEKVANIYKLLNRDRRYSGLRQRCNDHTHYNFYYNILLNDNSIYLDNRISVLNKFSDDLDNIFILHLSYLFYIKDHYMMSSDYLDSLECGLTPEPDSQYIVAPFIQEIFDSEIKKKRPDLAQEIKSNTAMFIK